MKRVLLLLVSASSCHPIQLAAPAAPSETIPDVRGVRGTEEPEKVPVVFDVVDGPTVVWNQTDIDSESDMHNVQVDESIVHITNHGNYTEHHSRSTMVGNSSYRSERDVVCVTPCLAWLAKTDVLKFEPLRPIENDGVPAIETTPYGFHPDAKRDAEVGYVMRVKLEELRKASFGVQFAGWTSIILGVSSLVPGAVAIPFSFTRTDYGDSDAWLNGGIAASAVGVGLITLGAVILAFARDVHRAHAVTTFAVPRAKLSP